MKYQLCASVNLTHLPIKYKQNVKLTTFSLTNGTWWMMVVG